MVICVETSSGWVKFSGHGCFGSFSTVLLLLKCLVVGGRNYMY